MSEKYIRQNKTSCTIVKNSRTYAKISDLEDAVFIRDFLVSIDWDLIKVPNILKKEDDYLVLTVYEDKIFILAKFKKKPTQDIIDKLVKRHLRNPNNSRYGLNISRIYDTFLISKQIAGDTYVFGFYDDLKDAEFVRNFLMDHQWNVNELGEIEYDEDGDNYKVVCVFDDKAYVLDSFDTSDIDLNKTYEDFVLKVSKHKYGLAEYPHLDELKDRIGELEDMLNVRAHDDVWTFGEETKQNDALRDIVFTLTPFQKSVYDAIDGEADFDDIKRKLIRFRSGNFDEKIQRNLDELIEKDLIEKEGNYFKKSI